MPTYDYMFASTKLDTNAYNFFKNDTSVLKNSFQSYSLISYWILLKDHKSKSVLSVGPLMVLKSFIM
jgi:hypothetical protein